MGLPCSITNGVASQMSAINASLGLSASQVDEAAIMAANSESLFGMPALDALLANIASGLGALGLSLVDGVFSGLAGGLGKISAVASTAIAGIAMLATLGNQLAFFFPYMLTKRITNRLQILRQLEMHYKALSNILRMLTSPKGASYLKTIRALPFVSAASQQMSAAADTVDANYVKASLQNVNKAIDILTEDISSVVPDYLKGVAKNPSAATVASAASAAKKALRKSMLSSMIKTVTAMEGLVWHSSHIISTVYASDALVSTILPANKMSLSNVGSGVWGKDWEEVRLEIKAYEIFDKTIAETQLSDLKKQLNNIKSSKWNTVFTAERVQAFLSILDDIDSLMGLLPLNLISSSLIDSIINLDNNTKALDALSKALFNSIMSSYNTINGIKLDMEDAQINPNETELTLSGKELVWVTKLKIIAASGSFIMPGLESVSTVLRQTRALSALQNYLRNTQLNLNASEMPGWTFDTILAVAQAPFSKRSLSEAIVRVNFILRQIQSAILKDEELLGYTSAVGTPMSQFTDLLNLAKNLPHPAGAIAGLLMSGQMAEVLGLLGSIGALGATLTSDTCPDTSKSEDPEATKYQELQKRWNKYDGV